jgi:tagatose 1,6-diphosphate aldolase
MSRVSLSPGKIRGLTATSTSEGVFTILAIDHRDSLRVVVAPDAPARIPAAALTEIKLNLLRSLGAEASGVMLDPEYSAAQAVVTRALPGSVGFLAALEAQGYLGDPVARQTMLLDGWTVEKAKRLGASGVKLLVLYRPDAGPITEAQDEVVAKVVTDCAVYDIPLFLEPLAYPSQPGMSTDSADFAELRRAVVVETVRRLGTLRPDILKVQFPVDCRREPDQEVWREACAELDAASPVPWALLSGGEPYELFREQVRIACEAGASGFMVGRALWRDAVTAPADEQRRLVETVVRPRFRELAAIVRTAGRDWADRHVLPTVDEDWYRSYRAFPGAPKDT